MQSAKYIFISILVTFQNTGNANANVLNCHHRHFMMHANGSYHMERKVRVQIEGPDL